MKKQRVEEIIEQFKNKKVLIIGDVMLDAYIFGNVERISPEAPVPVVNLKKNDYRLGGAANVAVNIISLGAKANMCCLLGSDEEGKLVESLLTSAGIGTQGIYKIPDKPTTVKTRVIANNHQLLRIDREDTLEPKNEAEKQYIELVCSCIKNHDVILFSDYDKGSITAQLISEVTQIANQLNIPVVVDPKKKHFSDYKNVTLFKPNLKELGDGLNSGKVASDTESLTESLSRLEEIIKPVYTMITLSEHGIYFFNHQSQQGFLEKAHLRNVADVSGAGDSVVSVASLCLASGCNGEELVFLSNLAGGLVCEEVGVVPVDPAKLMDEAAVEEKML